MYITLRFLFVIVTKSGPEAQPEGLHFSHSQWQTTLQSEESLSTECWPLPITQWHSVNHPGPTQWTVGRECGPCPPLSGTVWAFGPTTVLSGQWATVATVLKDGIAPCIKPCLFLCDIESV